MRMTKRERLEERLKANKWIVRYDDGLDIYQRVPYELGLDAIGLFLWIDNVRVAGMAWPRLPMTSIDAQSLTFRGSAPGQPLVRIEI